MSSPSITTDANSSGPEAFFVTGGTVPFDSASYVTRQADRDLLESLLAGQFCYVLNARQMGKSSLSVRTMAQLTSRGVRTVFLDLTKIGGQNVTPEQWYVGLLSETGRLLGLRSEMVAYWRQNADRSLAERYFGALREVALERLPPNPSSDSAHLCDIVIFVDEIDATRSLPFSVDEFFAAIRAFYNDRVHDPVYGRLAFCLVGSALPSELIRDTRISPFNIGRRIELRDFTFSEALPLVQGLPGKSEALLRRIFYWTNGNPFLTQSLCAEIAAHPAQFRHARDVDRLVRALFFEVRARSRNVNLSDVANRLLRITDAGDAYDRAAILTFYRKLLNRRQYIADDEAEPLVGLLKLAGITRSEGGRLFVRCRIYEHVFDAQWVDENMPDAELRRQRTAFRRGVVRTALLASAVLAAITTFAVIALLNARAAHKAEEDSRLELYISEIDQASNALNNGELRHARELLDELRPKPGQTDLREFTWRMLDRRAHDQSEKIFANAGSALYNVALSPDGKYIATEDSSGNICIWYRDNGNLLSKFSFGTGSNSINFSPDSKYIFTISNLPPNPLRMWDWRTGTVAKKDILLHLRNSVIGVAPVYFDDRRLMAWVEDVKPGSDSPGFAAPKDNGPIDIVQISDFRVIKKIDALSPVVSLFVTQNKRTFVVGRLDGRVQQYSTSPPYSEIDKPLDISGPADNQGRKIFGMALAPDGHRVATYGLENDDIYLWDLQSRRLIGKLPGSRSVILQSVFLPDGKTLVTVGTDGAVHVWDTQRKTNDAVLFGHQAGINSMAVASDGKTLYTSSWDGTVRQWNLATAERSGGIPSGQEKVIAPPPIDRCIEENILVRSDDQTLTAERLPNDPNAVRVTDIVDGQTVVLHDPGAIVAPSDQPSPQFTPDGQYLWALSQPLPQPGSTAYANFQLKRWDWRRGVADHSIPLPTLLSVPTNPPYVKSRLTKSEIVSSALQIDAVNNIALCIDDRNQMHWLDSLNGKDVVKPIPLPGKIVSLFSGDSEHPGVSPPNAHTGFTYSTQSVPDSYDYNILWLLPDRRTIVHYKQNTSTNQNDEWLFNSSTGYSAQIFHFTIGNNPGGYFTPDAKIQLIQPGNDTQIQRYDLTTRPPRPMTSLAAHSTYVWSFRGVTTTAPNGSAQARVLTMSPDGDVHVNDPVNDPGTGVPLADLRGHLQVVTDADLSPDGRTAATASMDQTVALWDVPTHSRLALIPLHFTPNKVRFSRRAGVDVLIVTDTHQNRLILRGSDTGKGSSGDMRR